MTHTKHTPGPWEYRGNRLGIVKRKGQGIVAITYGDVDENGDEKPDNDAAMHANARLIAASPLMLEALKSTLPRLRGELSHDHPELLQVEAAIAQAEGEV